MQDAAVVVYPGVLGAVAMALGMAIAPPTPIAPEPPPVVELPETVVISTPPVDECVVTGVTDVDQRRALELACVKFGEARPFKVFSTANLGRRRAVFVWRETGECGGCGGFTVAVIFRDGELEVVEKLGEYGRFSHGPDTIRFFEVAGYPMVEVDETISIHGYTSAYKELFVLQPGKLQFGLCIMFEGSDAGMRDNASEWKATPWIANEGTFYSSPSYTKRGDVTPVVYAYSFPFKHGRWILHEGMGRCIDPRGDWEDK